MLSDMELPWTDEMGGKEGLSSLGYSRRFRSDELEVWATDSYPVYKLRFLREDGMWGCEPTELMRGARYAVVGLMFRRELLSAAKRIAELEGGDE